MKKNTTAKKSPKGLSKGKKNQIGQVNDLQNSAQKPSGRLSGRVSRAFFGGPLAYQGPRLCGSSLIPLPVEAAHYILGSQIHDSTCYLYVTLYIRVLCYSYVISLRI